VRKYREGLKRLVSVVGPNVSLEPESEMIATREIPEKARHLLGLPAGAQGSAKTYFDVADAMKQKILAYLRASEGIAPTSAADKAGILRVQALKEWKELDATGFTNVIPENERAEVRSHMSQRAGGESREQVAKYFAVAYARDLLGVRESSSVTAGGKRLQPLAFSFTPDGSDENRIEWTVANGRGASPVPSWAEHAGFVPTKSSRLVTTVTHFSKDDPAIHKPVDVTFRSGNAVATVPAFVKR
jgi:hypothetical protein